MRRIPRKKVANVVKAVSLNSKDGSIWVDKRSGNIFSVSKDKSLLISKYSFPSWLSEIIPEDNFKLKAYTEFFEVDDSEKATKISSIKAYEKVAGAVDKEPLTVYKMQKGRTFKDVSRSIKQELKGKVTIRSLKPMKLWNFRYFELYKNHIELKSYRKNVILVIPFRKLKRFRPTKKAFTKSVYKT